MPIPVSVCVIIILWVMVIQEVMHTIFRTFCLDESGKSVHISCCWLDFGVFPSELLRDVQDSYISAFMRWNFTKLNAWYEKLCLFSFSFERSERLLLFYPCCGESS